jgi:ABC-2 type transport system permease protein
VTWAVLRKDLVVLWTSPLPWVAGALLHLCLGLLYVNELDARRQAVAQPLFPLAGFLLLIVVPVLTMRSVAEERRMGTLDLLRAIPVSPWPIVIGKWSAAWLTTLVVLLPSGAYIGLVALWGDPDPGPITAGFLGLVLFSAAVAGIGVLASSATSSQPVAAVATLVVCLVLWFAHVGSTTIATGALLAHLSISERLRTFAGGAVDTGDAVFLVVLAGVCLAAAVSVLEPRRLAAAVLVVVVLVVVDVGADRTRRLVDLTESRSLTLSTQTKEVVGRIDRRVRITALLARRDPGRAPAAALLDRYRRLNRRISVRILDPSAAPGEVRRLGVDPVLGGLAVTAGDRSEVAATASEQDITAALARLQRDRTPLVCFSAGHGEADPRATTQDGMSFVAEALGRNGYRVEVVELLTATEVPERCEGLVVANPTTALGETAAAVTRYLERGGRALVLTDPASEVDLSPLLSFHALGTSRGIVLETDEELRFPDDPTRPIVLRYQSPSPIARRLPPTFFPGAQSVTVAPDDQQPEGVAAVPVAATSGRSFLEREPLVPSFDPAVDVQGPIVLVAASDRSAVVGGAVNRSRVVVTGDVDFATNAFAGEAGNSTLVVRALDWLTLEEDLVTVSANVPALRLLQLTAARLQYARLLSVVVIPGLFLLLGAVVWAVRRGR